MSKKIKTEQLNKNFNRHVTRHNNPDFVQMKTVISRKVVFQTKACLINQWETEYNLSEFTEIALIVAIALSKAREISSPHIRQKAIAQVVEQYFGKI